MVCVVMGLKVDIKSKLDSFDMDISFETSANRIGILGASGMGKSMLLKYISGIVSPDEGLIMLNGDFIFDTGKKVNIRPQNRNIAYMFQNYALFPNMSVRKNIEIIIDGSSKDKQEKATRLMKKFYISDLENKKPSELSGGQQQRVALARIMAYEPKLILLDEPFSAMDKDLKEKLQIELEEMTADYEGMIIMVSHSKDEIFRFSEELIIIDSGRVVEHAMTKELFETPITILGAKTVGVNNILDARLNDDSNIEIPTLNINIPLVNLRGFDKERLGYVGIRDIDFHILKPGEVSKNFVDAKVEKIFEGVEFVKVFFSLENSDELYSLRINKSEDEIKLLNEGSLRLSIDENKLVYIEK